MAQAARSAVACGAGVSLLARRSKAASRRDLAQASPHWRRLSYRRHQRAVRRRQRLEAELRKWRAWLGALLWMGQRIEARERDRRNRMN